MSRLFRRQFDFDTVFGRPRHRRTLAQSRQEISQPRIINFGNTLATL